MKSLEEFRDEEFSLQRAKTLKIEVSVITLDSVKVPHSFYQHHVYRVSFFKRCRMNYELTLKDPVKKSTYVKVKVKS